MKGGIIDQPGKQGMWLIFSSLAGHVLGRVYRLLSGFSSNGHGFDPFTPKSGPSWINSCGFDLAGLVEDTIHSHGTKPK